jgi:spermidine synthase
VKGVIHGKRSQRPPIAIDRPLALAVFALGGTAMVTQVVLLREFLSTFYGNELVLGVILASWMALTGVGAFLGRHSTRVARTTRSVMFLLILLALLPLCLVFLLRVLRNVVFIYGSMIGITDMLVSSLVLLFPFCLLSGFLFTYLAHLISDLSQKNRVATVYAIEATGSVVGALAFTLIMSPLLTTFQSLLILLVGNVIVAAVLAMTYGPSWLAFTLPAAAVAVLVGGWQLDLDGFTRRLLFRDQEILYSADTPYGTLTVTRQGEQVNFYENSLLLFSTQDPVLAEETVHLAMVQHPHPRSVLLISGGLSGALQEILKYDVGSIDYVELNPWLIEVGRRFTDALPRSRVNVIVRDARLFVKETRRMYDVVLINVPEPGTAQLNRVYTLEFLRELKPRLRDRAVLCMSLASSADYLSPEARLVRSTMYATLKAEFAHVIVLPATRDYFLASDGSLSSDVARMIEERKISTVYVNKYYFDDELLEQRSRDVRSVIDSAAALNRDFVPIAYYRQVVYWLSQFEINYWIMLGFGVVLLAVLIRRLNPISAGMFTGGFAAAGIEFLLLISFQIIYGYVYQAVGVIIAVFMAGLASGAWFQSRHMPATKLWHYVLIQLAVAGYAVVLPFAIEAMQRAALNAVLVYAAFFLLTLIIAFLIGAEFSLATRLRRGSFAAVAAELYGVDLAGSAIGALLIAAVLVPVIGIPWACASVALLSVLSALVAFAHRAEYMFLVQK